MKMKRKHVLLQLFAIGVLALSFGACADDNIDKGKTTGTEQAKGNVIRFGGYIDSVAQRENEVASGKTRMTGYYGNLPGKTTKGIRFYFDEDEEQQGSTWYGQAGQPFWAYVCVNKTTNQWQWVAGPQDGKMDIMKKDAKGVIQATWSLYNYNQNTDTEEYKIRYGRLWNNGGAQDKWGVYMQYNQEQPVPGKATRLRYYGDYATATAFDNGLYYEFTLKHHSAFITFMPYADAGKSHDVLTKCKLLAVRIRADEDLVNPSSFPVDDNGFLPVTSAWPYHGNGYKWAYVSCVKDWNDFGNEAKRPIETDCAYNIPATKALAAKNGAIMVVRPGTYHNVKIDYLVWEPEVDNYVVFTKEEAELTLNPGLNKPIYSKLKCKDYTDDFFNSYHMWGAKSTYWDATFQKPAGYKWNADGYKMPGSTPYYLLPAVSQDRYYNNVTSSDATQPVDAPVGSLDYNAPTANMYWWYIKYGDPRIDTEPFTYDGHLFGCRLWFLKASMISSIKGISVPDMSKKIEGGGSVQKTSTSYSAALQIYNQNNRWETLPEAQRGYYFYVLPLGGYYQGDITKITNHKAAYNNSEKYAGGYYWSSTATNNADYAWYLSFNIDYYLPYFFNNSYIQYPFVYRVWISLDQQSTYSGVAIGDSKRNSAYPKWPGETLTYN